MIPRYCLFTILLLSLGSLLFGSNVNVDPQREDTNLQREQTHDIQFEEDKNLQQERTNDIQFKKDKNLQQERTKDIQFFEDQNLRQEKPS